MTHIYDIPDSTDQHPEWHSRQVTDRSFCLRADNVDELTVTGTNTWLVAEPGAHEALVVDPGPDDPVHLSRLMRLCNNIDLHIAAIVITHKHLDHVMGVPLLLDLLGESIPVYGRAPFDDLMLNGPASFDYRPLPDGPFAPFEGCPAMEVVSLPGHCSDEIGLILADDHAMLSGDMMFRDWSTVIVFPDGTLTDYFNSLNRIQRLDSNGTVKILLTGHGRPIGDLASATASYIVHRMKRLEEQRQAIAQLHTDEPEKLLTVMYQGLDEQLKQPALTTIRAQNAYLRDINDPVLANLEK